MLKLIHNNKAQIWISAILYTLIIIVALTIVLDAINPIIKTYKYQTIYELTKDQLISLDRCIQEVSSSLPGTTKICGLAYDQGTLYLTNSTIKWKLKTEQELIYPGVKEKIGNLNILSNSNVNASYKGNYAILENNIIKVNITRIGDENNFSDINTSQVINYILFKPLDKKTSGHFEFLINKNPEYSVGKGYVKILNQGSDLDKGVVVVHVNNSYISYNLYITLLSGSDFISVRLGDVKYGS